MKSDRAGDWPGIIIEREMKGRGWNQARLSRELNRPSAFVSDLIRGKRTLTSQSAVQMQEVLGLDARVLLESEAMYRLRLKGQAPEIVSVDPVDDERRNQPVFLATHGSLDHPLHIGGATIPCYVLEDGRRVLARNGMLNALELSKGGNNKLEGNRLAAFAATQGVSRFLSDEAKVAISNPVRLQDRTGREMFGYEAFVLSDVCEAVLAAKDVGVLNYQQGHIATQCVILLRAFARVGIVALVDEATGYQEDRGRRALEEILQRFISAELMKWVKTFPDDYYRQLFRLRGWRYSERNTKRPGYLAQLTTDVVYDRLAPGVTDELKRLTPRTAKGNTSHRYHQHLTEHIGHPKLREHLASVVTLMKASETWGEFQRALNRALPRWTDQMALPFLEHV